MLPSGSSILLKASAPMPWANLPQFRANVMGCTPSGEKPWLDAKQMPAPRARSDSANDA